MIYLNKFDTHASYETELNGGGVDISLPNVSYCEDVKDVHYLPYNLVRFYVGEITTSHTVSIYTDSSTSIPIQISEGNKWYSYVLPKDKGLFKIEGSSIEGDSVKKVVVKANISTDFTNIIPFSTVEASFKGRDNSKINNMISMFYGCSSLTSLDLSKWDTSKLNNMSSMFYGCSALKEIKMIGCSPETVGKIQTQLEADGITGATITQ